MAPPKKPTHLAIIQGNPGKRALPKNEPKPDHGFDPAPDYFTAQEVKWYNEFAGILDGMGVMTHADSRSVEMLTKAYSEFRKLDEIVCAEGHLIQSQNMHGEATLKANPAVGMMSDAWRRFRGMATEFGLTPSSRSKVSVVNKEKRSSADDLLNRKRK